MPARIGVVDDQPAFLVGVAAILERGPELRVVATAATVRGLLDESPPLDIVLLGLALADGSRPRRNLDRLAALDASTVVLAARGQDTLATEALEAGAVASVARSDPPESILHAVRRVARRAGLVPVEATCEPCAPLFSDRETQVLRLYAEGRTAELVADALFISRDTVNHHIRRIRGKYAAVGRAAPTRVDLFKRAAEDGLV